jgi:hypothetical protein
MAHNIYITGIHVEYQTKNSNFNLVLDEYLIILNYIKKIVSQFIIKNYIIDNPCYFLTLLKFEISFMLHKFMNNIFKNEITNKQKIKNNDKISTGIFILLV